ncbi:MAG: hypothetical protein KME49_31015 [Brasilonema octagenarum HA4186-MV1]|jgi:hypothetical protein|nr:hypothetical protein [Brasilonema octagenarum HA4186-MV1]
MQNNIRKQNNIKKFVSPGLLGIPLVGALVLVGLVVNRPKPVMSNQLAYIDQSAESAEDSGLPTYTWLHQNSSEASSRSSELTAHKETRLRKALASVTIPTDVTKSNGSEAATSTVAIAQPQTPTKTASITPTAARFPQQDGVYLYGQSPKSGQLGQGYIIFEKHQNKVTGALYMPSSEFSCFNGTLRSSGELAMTVNGFAGDESPTQVAANNTLPQVKDGESSTYAHSVTLQDYNQINNISSSDRQVLQTCQANVQK